MKLSLILPYWDRQEATDRALSLLATQYQGMNLEVVVVDDGNPVPFRVPDIGLTIKVVRLPTKNNPMCPTAAWNAGVAASTGDILVLSCAEILHVEPVLQQMAIQLEVLGPGGYVLASAWCPEEGKWHCHSTVSVPTCPRGTGIAFCAALHRELWDKAGGFDDAYRSGAGYEDRDFIWRLHRAGAVFVHRDDLKVIHPKSGATIAWGDDAFRRNRGLYLSKWEGAEAMVDQPVTFVCLKAGTAYGAEYVNVLRDMIARNLPDGYPGRFVCLTDDAMGLDPEIEVLPLPADLETWWGKLYLFKRGLFRDGERVIFMDLDTLVLGPLDDLVRYRGQFATLRDFYHPQQIGPAVITWQAGAFASSIWEEWVAEGKPRHPMGDLWWLNRLDQGRFAKEVGILQDLLPGQFASFKADCHPYPPAGACVVCFHGQPKPDNCPVSWVADVWRVGGSGNAELEAIANTTSEVIADNIRAAIARDYPWIEPLPAHDGQAVIVGGGPSLLRTLPEIKRRAAEGQTVFALNGAARFLNEEGVIPQIQVIIDARPENAEFVRNALAYEYLLASQCAPEVFDAASKFLVGVFHMNTPGIGEILPSDRQATLISSGTTVGLAAMALAYVLGFRAIHLHGFDSSYDEAHHAYAQPGNDADTVMDVSVNGRSFKAAPWMVMQAQQFQTLAQQLVQADVVITVAGDGLLPHIAHCMNQPQGESNVCC